MPGERIWRTYRDGNWSAPFDDPSSPWYHATLTADLVGYVPRGGAGEPDLDNATAGDTVIVEHALTVDGAFSCGNSMPAAPWDAPMGIVVGGLFTTNLPTGEYRASYYLRSSYGSTSVGLSETDPFDVVQGVSHVRASFPPNRPAGSTYVLVLTEAGGAAGTGRVYCRDITGPTVDMRVDTWENTEVGGGAAQGPNSRPFAAASPPPDGSSSAALIVESTGRLIFADGSLLTIRGDWMINSPDGSTDTWATFRGTGDYEFNSSRAQDPTHTEYRVIWQGHGKFAWTA